jgi:hypothetical protein
MAALVVTLSRADALGDVGMRIGVFPGGASPTIYPANMPFWIGYGFMAEPGSSAPLDGHATRFELDVDGEPALMATDVRGESDVSRRKTDIADFPAGLPPGWHDFAGRWFDAGRLVLSSRSVIQFVEP